MALRKVADRRLTASERKLLLKRGLGPFVFELEFWAQADRVGPHCLWRGKVDAQGRPIHFIGGDGFLATSCAWRHYKDAPVPRGKRLEPTCGEPLCVHPDHFGVVRAGR